MVPEDEKSATGGAAGELAHPPEQPQRLARFIPRAGPLEELELRVDGLKEDERGEKRNREGRREKEEWRREERSGVLLS